jgi:uncharacterized phiE125 gp8 family phage protein
MKYALEITSQPAAEPITVSEAKAHLRVDHTTDDTYIESLITASRVWAERYQARAYINQTWKMYLDAFPVQGYIPIPIAPLSSVTSITYVDINGDTQTLDAARYQVDSKVQPSRVYLAPGVSWPSTRFEQKNAVTITFVAGYGATSASVPASMKHAIKMLVSDMYQNRESEVVGKSVATLQTAAKALLDQNRLYKFRGIR